MGWIKRNLLFVIGAAVALALLGGGGYYIYSGWTRNSTASEQLKEKFDQLKSLLSKNPSPGNDKINNIDTAKAQNQQVQAWIATARNYFQPIPPIPPDAGLTTEGFAAVLLRTVGRLQHEADEAGVVVPPKYDFSFAAEKGHYDLDTANLPQLAGQLGEVKALAETIFGARVNALDSIQRVRVSRNDDGGLPADYIDEHSVTNDLAVITPYVLTFRCFTPELARVLGAFATSTNAFLIKSINVQPAGAAAGTGAPPDQGGGYPGRLPGEPGMMPGGAPVPPPAAGKGGLQTVLKEQLLRVTMEVGLVKLLPPRS